MNRLQVALAFLFLSSFAQAANVIDVSKEWNAHISTNSPLGIRTVPTVTVKTSSPAVDTCGCETYTAQQNLEEATYAFTGFVDRVGPIKKDVQKIIFDVDEVFKGSPKPEMEIEFDIKKDGCDLPFESGQSYLVFTKWEWGRTYSHRCFGTKLLAKANRNALGPSEELKEKLYIRLRNACMGRRDTSCCLSSLKAMRAGYYVPEPEGGCPDGMLPDRLRCSGSYTWCIQSTDKRAQP